MTAPDEPGDNGDPVVSDEAVSDPAVESEESSEERPSRIPAILIAFATVIVILAAITT